MTTPHTDSDDHDLEHCGCIELAAALESERRTQE